MERMARDDDTIERVLDAASALLAGRGAEFSMAEVAERAGLSRGTVYRRFASRQALVDRLVAERGVDPEAVADTRERILDAVAALIAERGLAATTMDQVAERGGVGTMTVYRHFGDRQRLLRAYASERTPRRLAARLELDSGDDMEPALCEFLAAAIAFLAGNPELVRLQFAPNEESAALMAAMRKGSQSSNAALLAFIERQVARGRLCGDPVSLRNALLGMVLSMSRFERERSLRDPCGTARFIVDLFLRGCSREHRPRRTARRTTQKPRRRKNTT
jgi:AcrR family transcriptional regulator